MVLSLLTLSYSKTNVTYEDIMNKPVNSFDRIIYDKVVKEVRLKISRSLNIYRRKLILKYIYIARTEGLRGLVMYACGEDAETYNKLGLWKIALLHSILTYILYDTDEERIEDIKDMAKMLLNKHSKNMNDIRLKLFSLKEGGRKGIEGGKGIENGKEKGKSIDLYQYIDIYLLFGNRLKD